MLLRSFAILTILFFDVPFYIKGVPLHLENDPLDTAESNDVHTEIQSLKNNVVIGHIVADSSNKVGNKQNSVEESGTGKAAKNNIRDKLLDNTFESVDFSNAIPSADGKKECVNKTQFVETVVSDW